MDQKKFDLLRRDKIEAMKSLQAAIDNATLGGMDRNEILIAMQTVQNVDGKIIEAAIDETRTQIYYGLPVKTKFRELLQPDLWS